MNYPNGRSRWLAAGIAALAVSLAPLSQGASLEVAGDEEARLDLFVNSSSPETSPSLGAVQLYGNAQTTTRVLYGAIQGEAARPVDGDEDGELFVSVAANGAASEIVRVTSAGLTISGAVSASNGFSGDGAGLTGVNADHLGGYAVSDFASSAALGFYALLDSTNQPFTGHVQATEFRISGSRVLDVDGSSTFVGAGTGSSGNYAVYLGKNAGGGASGGDNVIAIGYQPGYSVTTGWSDILIGAEAGYSLTDGYKNVMIGGLAGRNSTTGDCNVFMGRGAGYTNGAKDCNVYLGHNSGYNNAGSYNTFVGGDTDGNPATADSSIAIGYKAAPTADRQALIGSADANGYVADVYLGSGVQRDSPQNVTVHATNAATGNTNGANLRIVAGKKAGTGSDGDVYLAYDGSARVGNVRIPSLLILQDVATTKSVASNEAHLYSYNGRLYCADAYGNKTLNSPHRFAMYQPAPDDPLPWTYYSENRFIGKRVNADISGALRDLEKLTKKQYLHVEDMPADETQDWEQWREAELQRLTFEAMERELTKNPWVEIAPAEALEEVPETRDVETPQTVTRYRMNFGAGAVEPYETTAMVVEKQPTGRTVKQFREGCWLDETTGKCYRPRTLDEVEIDPGDIPEIEPPQWLRDRMR